MNTSINNVDMFGFFEWRSLCLDSDCVCGCVLSMITPNLLVRWLPVIGQKWWQELGCLSWVQTLTILLCRSCAIRKFAHQRVVLYQKSIAKWFFRGFNEYSNQSRASVYTTVVRLSIRQWCNRLALTTHVFVTWCCWLAVISNIPRQNVLFHGVRAWWHLPIKFSSSIFLDLIIRGALA